MYIDKQKGMLIGLMFLTITTPTSTILSIISSIIFFIYAAITVYRTMESVITGEKNKRVVFLYSTVLLTLCIIKIVGYIKITQ